MNYELMIVLKPSFSEEELQAKIEEIKKLIVGNGGEVVKEDAWGKRVLAYPINKLKEGVYHLLNFKLAPSEVGGLEKRLNLEEDILRFLVTRAD